MLNGRPGPPRRSSCQEPRVPRRRTVRGGCRRSLRPAESSRPSGLRAFHCCRSLPLSVRCVAVRLRRCSASRRAATRGRDHGVHLARSSPLRSTSVSPPEVRIRLLCRIPTCRPREVGVVRHTDVAVLEQMLDPAVMRQPRLVNCTTCFTRARSAAELNSAFPHQERWSTSLDQQRGFDEQRVLTS